MRQDFGAPLRAALGGKCPPSLRPWVFQFEGANNFPDIFLLSMENH